MTQQRKSRWPSLLRDLFLGGLALVILYTQLFLDKPAQPILIFLVIFLFGSIPALRGDNKGNRPSTFARVVMSLMGVQFPENFSENEEGMPPSADGPTPSPGPSHAERSESSSKSSSASTKEGA